MARSVRNRDCVTSRIRGGARSYLERWHSSAIGTGRVKALCSTSIDSRTVEFDYTSGAEEVLWATATPSKTDCLGGVVDVQGNLYVLDGPAGIAKYNSAGTLLYKIALPVADPAHVVRALTVDDSLRIFAAVSEGGDVATARVFSIIQLTENEYHIVWTLEPGAYTEALRVYRGTQLYAAHNYPTENRARVLVYEDIAIQPREASRIESAAYPIHAMDVLDGAVYCTSGDNHGDASTGSSGTSQTAYRKGHPGARGHHPPITAWTPWQLDDAKRRIHAWYDAADIDTTDLDQEQRTEAAIEEGMQILRWRDKSGNNRHWYAGSFFDAGESGPTYSKVGPGGLPAVRFTNVGTTKQSLVTYPNASISKTTADQQRTAIPAHEGAMFALFILMRPQVDDVVGTDPRVVFYAENDGTTGTPGPHGLWINRACGATQPGTFSAGKLSYFAKTDNVDDGACATADQAAAYGYTSSVSRFTDCALVTIVWDGGIDPNDTTKTRCLFRVNGSPVDRFEGLEFESLKANYLAYAPTVAAAVANRFNGELCEILSLGRRDRFDDSTEPKVLTHDLVDFNEDFPGGQAQTDNELARIESYILHRRGLGHLLGGIPGGSNPAGLWPHFYQQDDADTTATPTGVSSPPDYDGAGRNAALEQITQRYPIATKHNERGQLVWACNENTHPDTGNDRGGIGYGITARKIDDTVHVWLVGPDAVQATTGDVAARKIIDLGESFSGLSADGAWFYKFTSNRDYDYLYPRLVADKFGNLYLPYFEDDAAPEWSLLVLKKDGVAGVGQVLVDFLLPDDQQAHAVAIQPDALTPEYRGDLTTEMAEYVYLFTENTDDADVETVHKLQLVTTNALASGSPRAEITLAAVEDDVRLVTDAANTVVASATFDPTAQFVQIIRAGEDLVLNDGSKLYAYKLRDAEWGLLESESAGEVPVRVRYAAFWRHRLLCVLEGGKFIASRLGRIRDWNLSPGMNIAGVPLQTSTQAFTGSITRAGEAEDSIATVIPVHDDLCFLVGYTRVLRMTGDPMDNGQIHVYAPRLGGVFGDSWCIDDKGRVFVWGNTPPGLYQFPPEADPIPLSDKTLEASEFADIDLTTHRIVLAWDPVERGVRIYQVAWADSSIVAHWFWEERTHEMITVPPVWQDRYASADLQPTAVTYLGGDATRTLLVGCADGVIRRYSPDARDDDGTSVDSFVVFELTTGMPPKTAARVLEVEVVLAADQEGCIAELFSGETAERLGPIIASTSLKPGRNVWKVRRKGAKLWLRLRNAATGRWAFETGSFVLEQAGKVRALRV